MRALKKRAIASSVVGFGLAVAASSAKPPGIVRTDLQRQDISPPGWELIQVRVEFAPDTAFGRHHHPGEEVIYVIEGRLEYEVEGRAPVTLGAGNVLFIPAGFVHAARNVGDGNAAELATYVVDRGKALVEMIP